MNRHPPSTPPTGAHRYATRVYYEDTDAGGVVYHATYLRMAERARTEALRDLGVAHADLASQHGLVFMVRRAEVDYAAPARLDDSLLVLTQPTKLRAATVDLRQSFYRDGEVANRPLVVAHIGLVCVGAAADGRGGFRVARIPERWRAALAGLGSALGDSLAGGGV